jgi:hypothetical protein
MVSIDHFRKGLLAQLARATIGGRIDILINSGELYRLFGGYPGSMHGMPSCCDAMQAEMKLGDTMLLDRASGAPTEADLLQIFCKNAKPEDGLPGFVVGDLYLPFWI